MAEFSWHDAYYSDLQSLYALLVAPIVFLVWRLAAPPEKGRAEVPEAARFVSGRVAPSYPTVNRRRS